MRRCAGKTGGQNDFFLVLKMFGNIANQRVNECCNLIDRSLQQQGGKDVVDVPKQGSMLGVKFGLTRFVGRMPDQLNQIRSDTIRHARRAARLRGKANLIAPAMLGVVERLVRGAQ